MSKSILNSAEGKPMQSDYGDIKQGFTGQIASTTEHRALRLQVGEAGLSAGQSVKINSSGKLVKSSSTQEAVGVIVQESQDFTGKVLPNGDKVTEFAVDELASVMTNGYIYCQTSVGGLNIDDVVEFVDTNGVWEKVADIKTVGTAKFIVADVLNNKVFKLRILDVKGLTAVAPSVVPPTDGAV